MAQTITSILHSPLTLSSAQNPLYITYNSGIVLTNGSPGTAIYGSASEQWAIQNSGTIEDTSTDSYGISLAGGGTVINTYQEHSRISGGDGIYIGGSGYVYNLQTIQGITSYGVSLVAGTVQNGSKFNSIASISGSRYGVGLADAGGTVTNFGTIDGASDIGVNLLRGGTVFNAGTIEGPAKAVQFAGSGASRLVVEPGAVFGNGAGGPGIVSAPTVAEASNTIELGSGAGAGTIANIGSQFTGFYGVTVDAGATWTLAGSDVLPNPLQVADAGTLTNAGLLGGGIALAGPTLSNATTGYVAVVGTAVAATIAVAISNLGTLAGLGVAGLGISLPAGGTLVDGGRVIGNSGTAVLFGGTGANLVALLPGATFGGTVVGSPTLGAGNALELEGGLGIGTVSGVGSEFRNFHAVSIDVGAYWVATGGNTLGAAGALANAGNLTVQGGALVADGGVTNGGIIQFDTATASLGTLGGAGSATLTGATVTLLGSVAAGQTIGFAGSADRLVLDSATSMSGTLQGFATGDVIDLTGFQHQSGDQATLLGGNLLRITGTSGTVDLQMSAGDSFDQEVFKLAPDDGSGSNLTLAAACFAGGTRLLTRQGECAVERLHIGDTVWAQRRGRFVPILWIGRRRVVFRCAPGGADGFPVRVSAGAFGDGLPHRELRLSPDHAVLVDGVLIPVRYLVNGSTIAEDVVDAVIYYHVELPAHDVVLADGLPCESYLDTGNRVAFEPVGAGQARPFRRLSPASTGRHTKPVTAWGT